MKIIFLGTGVPSIEPNHITAGASEVIQIGNDNLLFDCGRWVSYQLVKSGVMPWNINHLFFTHFFHYDHTCDYPTLILNSHPRRLNVYGPQGTKLWSETLFQATGDVRAPRALNNIKIHDIIEGSVCSGDGWEVIAVKTKHIGRAHTRDEPSLAYRVNTKETSIVISGDVTIKENAPYQANKNLIDLAENADIFIMDADASHTTPEDMGIAAQESNVKKVILTHIQGQKSRLVRQSTWSDYDEFIRKMKTHYKGEIVIAKDLMNLEI